MHLRRRLGALILATALALLAPACGGGNNDDNSRADGATSTTARRLTAVSADPGIATVLVPGRLLVGGNALVFGAPRFQVESYLNRALGTPNKEQDQTCDAGTFHTFAWTGLTAFVGDDGFAGWYADAPMFQTDAGVRWGSTTAAVQSAYPTVKLTETSLGTELFVDTPVPGLSGLLVRDQVKALWSGATCIAR